MNTDKFDLVKVGGIWLSKRDIAADLKVLTDLKKGALNADSLTAETGDVLKTIAHLVAFDATGGHEHWDRLHQLMVSADGMGTAEIALIVQAVQRLYNGTNHDLMRSNYEATVLASAARTASVDSADLTNFNARGVTVVIDETAHTDTPSVVFTIQGKSTLGSDYYDILASAAVTGEGVTVLKVYPGITAAVNTSVSAPLPRIWRVSCVHADTDSITYSISANYHN